MYIHTVAPRQISIHTSSWKFNAMISLFVIGYNQLDEFVGWNDQTTFMYTNVNM